MWRQALQTMARKTDAVTCSLFIDAGGWQAAILTLLLAGNEGLQVDFTWVCTAARAVEVKWVEAAKLLEFTCSRSMRSNAGLHNVLLSGAVKRSNWESALGIAIAIQQLPLPLDMFGLSGLICEETGWELSTHLLASSAISDQSDFCHNAAISACENMGSSNEQSWRLATFLLFSLYSLRVGNMASSISFNAAISACAASRKWQVATQQFQTMHGTHLVHDDVSFNALISSLERSGKWELALALLGRMAEMHIVPDEFSYNAAINVCKYAVTAGRPRSYGPA